MRELVLTPKFKRIYRKVVRKDKTLQRRIEDILVQMSQDVLASSLGTHKLSGELTGLWACSCGYDWGMDYIWYRNHLEHWQEPCQR